MTDPTDIEGQIASAMEPLKYAYSKACENLKEIMDNPPRDKEGKLDLGIVPAIRLAAEMAGKLVTKHEVSPGSSALDEIPADELRAMAAERERLLAERRRLTNVFPLIVTKEKPTIDTFIPRSQRTGG